MELEASQLVTLGIGGLAVLMALLMGVLYGSAGFPGDRGKDWAGARAIGFATLWMVIGAVAARSGALQRFDVTPPPMLVMMGLCVLLAFILGLGAPGRRLANLPLAVLVGVQVFRLPLEMLMHRAYEEGIMPVHLSYSGYNFDIVTGTLAIPLALALAMGVRVPRFIIGFWNLLGMVLLGVIAFVAVSGSPMVARWGSEPENLNTWVLHFPFIWLPTVLVVIALVGHLAVFRKMNREE
jgi:hypothetical protein